MAATVPYALRKQLEAADKCFADGNIKGAKMHADMAAALFSSAPEAQCAKAAFKVHAAAAAATKDKTDHYAVLGVKLSAAGTPDATTTDAVKKQHKALCALLATAKDTSAAVAAAYKLVDEALSALTDIKKSDVMASTYCCQQQQQVARRKTKQRQEDQQFQTRAATYQEEEDDDYYGGGRDMDSGRGGRHRGR